MFQLHSNNIKTQNIVCRGGKDIAVERSNFRKPIFDFFEGNFPGFITRAIKEMKLMNPTPIQSQVWPIALSGRDLIGIAPSGSGKTLSYILPACIQMRKQPRLKRGDGPIALVLAPTRELVQQIRGVCHDFGRYANIKSCCFFGGVPKRPQLRDAERGAHICIATPGRLINFLESGEVSLERCTLFILDEADFLLTQCEVQVRQIIGHIKPEMQTMMFSSTWPKGVEDIAKKFLSDFIVIDVSNAKKLSANRTITQIVEVIDETEKVEKLNSLLQGRINKSQSKAIVFANDALRVEELTDYLRAQGYFASALHGSKAQAERNKIIEDFKTTKLSVIVATDVATRGLDIDGIELVVNYDWPTHSEEYVHRIGRAARSKSGGTAHTFLTFDNRNIAGVLIDILRESNQMIAPDLKLLADMSKALDFKKVPLDEGVNRKECVVERNSSFDQDNSVNKSDGNMDVRNDAVGRNKLTAGCEDLVEELKKFMK